MSDEHKAVFLSYASQDANAAKRICDALRAAGIEVWFDQSELVGGDAWDAKIRGQIKACALFVPVISAAAQARREGYFRIEWKLAAQRTHAIADGTPFLLPVVIDGTKDADALVPEEFRAVQWTRLPGADTPSGFCARVKLLLEGDFSRGGNRGAVGSGDEARAPAAARQDAARPWLKIIVPLAGLAFGLVFAFRPHAEREPKARSKPATGAEMTSALPNPSLPKGVSEGAPLAARALALYEKLSFTRDDLAAAADFAQRATEREPDSAATWGVRAGVEAAWIFRNWDNSEKRRLDTQSFANRALTLDPNEPEALLALGHVLRDQGASAQAEATLRRGVAAHPDHVRLVRALGFTLYVADRKPEARKVLLDLAQWAPRDPLVRYELAMSYAEHNGPGGANPENLAASVKQLDLALAIQPFSSALILKAMLLANWRGDLPAMRATLDELDKLPLAERSGDRSVCVAMWAGLIERRPERVEAAAALTARTYFDDETMPLRPKAWSLALAHRIAGKDNLARRDWQAAEAVLRQRVKDNPANATYQVELAITLAWLEQRDEAARLIDLIEPVWREERSFGQGRLLARYHGAAGHAVKTAAYLAQEIDQSSFMSRKAIPLDPWWDKVRGQPEFDAAIASAMARGSESKP